MELDERLQLLQNAIDMVTEADRMVASAIHGTGLEANYKAYGNYGFNTLLGSGNPYDRSLYDLVENLPYENMYGEEEEEEYDPEIV